MWKTQDGKQPTDHLKNQEFKEPKSTTWPQPIQWWSEESAIKAKESKLWEGKFGIKTVPKGWDRVTKRSQDPITLRVTYKISYIKVKLCT